MAASTDRRILGKNRLVFADNSALKTYYEGKYREGGYDESGCVIRGVRISNRYHVERQKAALRLLAPQRDDVVLDAGCGNGALAALIAPHCREVYGIDIAGNALSPQNAGLPNLKFQQMNVEQLEFRDAIFDKVVCVETLEHVLNPIQALKEIARVLKPNGRFVLSYPTINETTMKHWHLSRRIPISEHLNEWSLQELRANLERDRLFTVIRTEGICFDLGPLAALKLFHRFFAEKITDLALAIRMFPGNSQFVALELRRS
jgi:ubiquinone/menaquinone biosynthesis C-methylase UbiE